MLRNPVITSRNSVNQTASTDTPAASGTGASIGAFTLRQQPGARVRGVNPSRPPLQVRALPGGGGYRVEHLNDLLWNTVPLGWTPREIGEFARRHDLDVGRLSHLTMQHHAMVFRKNPSSFLPRKPDPRLPADQTYSRNSNFVNPRFRIPWPEAPVDDMGAGISPKHPDGPTAIRSPATLPASSRDTTLDATCGTTRATTQTMNSEALDERGVPFKRKAIPDSDSDSGPDFADDSSSESSVACSRRSSMFKQPVVSLKASINQMPSTSGAGSLASDAPVGAFTLPQPASGSVQGHNSVESNLQVKKIRGDSTYCLEHLNDLLWNTVPLEWSVSEIVDFARKHKLDVGALSPGALRYHAAAFRKNPSSYLPRIPDPRLPADHDYTRGANVLRPRVREALWPMPSATVWPSQRSSSSSSSSSSRSPSPSPSQSLSPAESTHSTTHGTTKAGPIAGTQTMSPEAQDERGILYRRKLDSDSDFADDLSSDDEPVAGRHGWERAHTLP